MPQQLELKVVIGASEDPFLCKITIPTHITQTLVLELYIIVYSDFFLET